MQVKTGENMILFNVVLIYEQVDETSYTAFFIRNLLTPAGAALRSANFTLRVYNAEDLPQSKVI